MYDSYPEFLQMPCFEGCEGELGWPHISSDFLRVLSCFLTHHPLGFSEDIGFLLTLCRLKVGAEDQKQDSRVL